MTAVQMGADRSIWYTPNGHGMVRHGRARLGGHGGFVWWLVLAQWARSAIVPTALAGSR